ncbi:MAG: LytTR family transcriptional regulator DNA-binding domain-containing protein [Candidatus Delongbacteria bacterium]|nr:LytTR family transcriptional regulator DNA-binding domain-containing protein [Candidatus Delongbacteria bacterium]
MIPLRIRTLIIDDEKPARDLIRELAASCPELEIIGECRDGYEAFEMIRSLHPDLIFLDIQMPEMNGFELLQQLDPADRPRVVFSTAYDHYAIRAFEVNALDYLLKPYDVVRFRTAVKRVLDLEHDQSNRRLIDHLIQHLPAAPVYLQRILVKTPRKILFVNTAEIYWIEAMDDYVQLHLEKETHLISHTLQFLEERLDPARFVRIHRSSIINLDAMVEITDPREGRYQVRLKDGTILPLSRTGEKNLKKLMI